MGAAALFGDVFFFAELFGVVLFLAELFGVVFFLAELFGDAFFFEDGAAFFLAELEERLAVEVLFFCGVATDAARAKPNATIKMARALVVTQKPV